MEGSNAAIFDAQIQELEKILSARLDQISSGAQVGTEPHVAVEVEASWVPTVPKVNEFYYKGQYWCMPE